ncbi:hypothetical protein BBJ28_00012197 [Nothophytophthora sp. Chile5]|nr:hypothetical protein BBJ28_00012197 [Nothophytophthora sp. Chile5]
MLVSKTVGGASPSLLRPNCSRDSFANSVLQFWYGSTTTGASTAVDQEAGGDGRSDELGRTTAEEGDDSDELRSLLEGAQSETKSGSAGTENGDQEAELRAAIAQVADSAGAFYERVRAWQRIPRAFARLIGPERDLVPASALRRWLKAELGRPGMLPEGELLDEELVEYVAGLLDHPDFCQPDLLVLELHEFLGRNQNGVENAIQAQPARVNPELIEPPATAKTQPNNDTDPLVPSEREYKRRRASYRGKVGTKTGPAAFRELIQKHMVQLSLEADRELAHGGGFENKQAEDSRSGKRMRHEALNWRQFTDALAVRNRNRPGRRQVESEVQALRDVADRRNVGINEAKAEVGVEVEVVGIETDDDAVWNPITAVGGSRKQPKIEEDPSLIGMAVVMIATSDPPKQAGLEHAVATRRNQKAMVSLDGWKEG